MRCLALLLLALARAENETASQSDAEAKSQKRYKVLILGAGSAGIAAAQKLTENGIKNFLMLEGADYIGGRVKSAQFAGKTIEMGANWVQGTKGSWLWELTKRYKIKEEKANFDSWKNYDENGPVDDKLMRYGKFLSTLDEADWIASRREQRGRPDERLSATMARLGWRSKNKYDEGVEIGEIDYENTLGMRDISLLAGRPLDAYLDFKDEDRFVTDPRGWNTIFKELARDSGFLGKIKLNVVVEKIKDSLGNGVVVKTNKGKFFADYVIVTFSLGVLQNDVVRFEPELPRWKQKIFLEETFGLYQKVFFQFPEQFWPDKKEYMQYCDDLRGWYPIWQNMNHEKYFGPGPPYIIMVTLFDRFGKMVERQSDEKTIEQAMDVLKSMFPKKTIQKPIDVFHTSWSIDPLQYGSYASDAWKGYSYGKVDLRRYPLGHVFFAGEAMSRKYRGWVHGGLYSGNETAEELLACMKRPHKCSYYKYWKEKPRLGCTDEEAENYRPRAVIDDKSCRYEEDEDGREYLSHAKSLSFDEFKCAGTSELQSTESGWPGKCEGLKPVWASWFTGDAASCRKACEADETCGVWQVDAVGGCHHGMGYQCLSSWGALAPLWQGKVVKAAGMLQHGTADSVPHMHQVQGLRLVEKATRPTAAAVENCKSICLSNLQCRFWQYGSEGCRVEDPDKGYHAIQPALQQPAPGVLRGERIRHRCSGLQGKSQLPALAAGLGAPLAYGWALPASAAVLAAGALLAFVGRRRRLQRYRSVTEELMTGGSASE